MKKQIEWEGISLILLAQKVLYIPLYQTLVLSDWHLGKLGHFRQEGLFVPAMQVHDELDRLNILLKQMHVKRVVFLGDLFHSKWNPEWDEFVLYLEQFEDITFILTKGNHDILPARIMAASRLQIVDFLTLGEHLVLSHEPLRDVSPHTLNIVGHLHPGVRVRGRGRQIFRLPCFVMQDNVLILPAFGRWTGLHMIKESAFNGVYPIMGNEVMELF